jgi:hypothetical protein
MLITGARSLGGVIVLLTPGVAVVTAGTDAGSDRSTLTAVSGAVTTVSCTFIDSG